MRIRLGSIAMVDEGEAAGITSPDYVVFRTIPGKLHHRWFYYWFRSPWGDEFIRRLARGAVRQRLLFRRLAKATLEVPDWDVQVEFAKKLANVQQVRRLILEQLEAVEALPQALIRASALKAKTLPGTSQGK
jgi:type I restriction enzyme S subunit